MTAKLMTGAVTLSLLAAAIFRGNSTVTAFFLGVSGSALVTLLTLLPPHRHQLKLIADTLFRPREPIRVSISYLFRIRTSGRYLLIRGTRFPDQFQPVGGVYKFYSSAAVSLKATFGVVDDDLIPIDQTSDFDLRVSLPAKHLLGFLRWFDSARDRECTPVREFHEELISTGLLSPSDFPFPVVQFAGRHYEPLRYSPFAKSRELLVADIYELLLSETQEKVLEQAVQDNPATLVWATASQIERRGAVPGEPFAHQIALPATWLL